MTVEIFHNVETAAVDIEVDVALLEIGCVGLPDRHFGVLLFDKAPGGITDALAVDFGVDKQQFQLSYFALLTLVYFVFLTLVFDAANIQLFSHTTTLFMQEISNFAH